MNKLGTDLLNLVRTNPGTTVQLAKAARTSTAQARRALTALRVLGLVETRASRSNELSWRPVGMGTATELDNGTYLVDVVSGGSVSRIACHSREDAIEYAKGCGFNYLRMNEEEVTVIAL